MLNKARHSLVVGYNVALLVVYAILPWGRHSIRKAAALEIAALQSRNERYALYRYGRWRSILGHIDRHRKIYVGAIFLATAGTALWPYVNPYEFAPTFDIAPEDPLNISDFHSISATVQATVLALIIPLAVVLHEFVLTGKKLAENTTRFFMEETRVVLITLSSALYLIWVVGFEAVSVLAGTQLPPLAGAIEVLWLVFNLIVICAFMQQVYVLLHRPNFEAAIRRQTFLEIFPTELRSELAIYKFMGLGWQEKTEDTFGSEPEISMWRRDGGQVQAQVTVPTRSELVDVNSRVLLQLFKVWRLQQFKVRGGKNRHHDVPHLWVSPHLGQRYEGVVDVVTIEHGKDLGAAERWAACRAFNFRPALQDTPISDTSEILAALMTNAIADLREGDSSAFQKNLESVADLYGELLSLAETVDLNGEPINYALLEKGLGVRVFTRWGRSFHTAFEEVLRLAEQDRQAFSAIAHVGGGLLGSVLALPSKATLEEVVTTQGVLVFRLSDWWSLQADEQGLEHGAEKGTILKQPKRDLYLDRLRTFVGSWTSLLDYHLSPKAKASTTWTELGKLFPGFRQHLLLTADFALQACIRGDRDGAEHWVDELLRWNSGFQDRSGRHVFWNPVQRALLSQPLIEMDWPSVSSLLAGYGEPNEAITEDAVFRHVLLNLWRDTCVLALDYLLQWSLHAAPAGESNTLEGAKRMIRGGLSSDGERSRGGAFMTDMGDYLGYFVRSHIRQPRANASYRSALEGIADRFDSHTSNPMIPGRSYVRSGASIDVVSTAELVFASSRSNGDEDVIAAAIARFEPLLRDLTAAERLKSAADSAVAAIAGIDPAEVVGVFLVVTGTPDAKIEGELKQRLDALRKLLSKLAAAAGTHRTDAIRTLEVSNGRLQAIARASSTSPFSKENSQFPLSAFESLAWTDDTLTKARFRVGNFSKLDLVELDDTAGHSSDIDWGEYLSTGVAENLLGAIYNSARTSDLIARNDFATERDFVDQFLRSSRAISAQGDSPLLVVPSFGEIEFLERWRRSSWLKESSLPAGVAIETREKPYPGPYVFHVNDTPVYEFNLASSEMWLFPKEILEEVSFHRYANALPIEVSFEPDEKSPDRGTLTLEWQRQVNLDKHRRMHVFAGHPKQASKDAAPALTKNDPAPTAAEKDVPPKSAKRGRRKAAE
ncbi:hypothetical protein HJA77_04800 [Rhizobium bangladeshense]|uniref:hypothetical protein n=1 Tax=Rhizobium bangladeshense TaxID=1138189 RepID=UPI001C925FBC|nr:hypothetical protein [Rhizobium bangladeshense]MBY3580484.1 hypothetical protein [Rhizobium bangladeshense]